MKTPAAPPAHRSADSPPDARQRDAAACFGLWVFLVVVKFGNPVIFARRAGGDTGALLDPLRPPADIYEFLIASWPVSWSWGTLALLGLGTVFAGFRPWPRPHGLLALLAAWFAWVLLSATQTVDASLTRATVLHFAGVLGCFVAGYAGLSRVRDLRPIWLGLAAALGVVLWTALDQHFWGLERTRAAFEQLPEAVRARMDSPEFRQKLTSTRVFGTFVYPNALAGGILLLLPPALAGLLATVRHRSAARALVSVFIVAAAGALYWSGSKSGWLIALALGGLAVWHTRLKPAGKAGLITVLLAAGLLAFFTRHAGYFEKGASSLAARGDYWKAARQMMATRPLLGYGPGTFQVPYRALKAPESEMARLAHNDYLQQGCDSGVPALLAYGLFIAGSLFLLRPRRMEAEPWRTAIWLGLAGFAAQGLVEFGLYIPALAWPFFLFLGWLWAAARPRPSAISGGNAGPR